MTGRADRSGVGASMELGPRLSAQLSVLSRGAGLDELELGDGLSGLVSLLSVAVSGYAGLQLTLVSVGHPVQLTTLHPARSDDAVVTSLRVPLPLVLPDLEEGGRLVVWSSVPGSLVDLGADLGYVLERRADGPAGTPSTGVRLDADLPMPLASTGLRGLAGLATIHQAVGVLIEQGHDPRAAYQTLRDQAAGEGVSPVVWSDQLLRRLHSPLDRGDSPHDDQR